MKIRLKITVTGFVQGVGYRYFCYRKAAALGVTGYARNMVDGSVELEAEGEKQVLDAFIAELKKGPTHASVSKVTFEKIDELADYDDFRI